MPVCSFCRFSPFCPFAFHLWDGAWHIFGDGSRAMFLVYFTLGFRKIRFSYLFCFDKCGRSFVDIGKVRRCSAPLFGARYLLFLTVLRTSTNDPHLCRFSGNFLCCVCCVLFLLLFALCSMFASTPQSRLAGQRWRRSANEHLANFCAVRGDGT